MNKSRVIIILIIVLVGLILMIPAGIVLFYICCAIMQVMAWGFGVTYEAANTVCFIYLEPAILTLTATITACCLAYKLKPKVLWIPLAAFYVIPYYIGCFVIWSRYFPLGLDNACRLAYKDLEVLGNVAGVGYIAINLYLFIALFLGIKDKAIKIFSATCGILCLCGFVGSFISDSLWYIAPMGYGIGF